MSDDSQIQYLQRLSISHIATRILMSGVQLGVFETIGGGKKTASEIAHDTSTSVRGMRILLDCLVSFQLLTKSDQRYSLSTISSQYLWKISPRYMGHLFEDERSLEQWNHMNEAIRSGKPLRKKETQDDEAALFSGLARSLSVVNWQPAQRVAKLLCIEHAGMKVLDVACGSGVWGIAIAQADPQSHITGHDLPAILKITQSCVKQQNVEDQFDYLPGDLRLVEFGESRFDVVILGNIVHSQGEKTSRELLHRVYRSLKDSGRVAIIDIVPDEDRTGPQASLIVALAMLLDSEEGDLFTLSEYTSWLREAGFHKIDTIDIGSHSPLIIGYKSIPPADL
ncbi:MAG TPA: methyltransferase [Acidobacteriota bacterium]|nr:methyltransferase [Acidobacteriota bacterium]